MQKVSSKILTDIITSRCLQNNSNKPLLSLESKSLMMNSDQLSKLMETNSETLNIYRSLKILSALNTPSMTHTVEPSRLILNLGSISLDLQTLRDWWRKWEIKWKEAELDLESSYKIMILLEKVLLKLLNSELHSTLRNFNWLLKSTRSLKITIDALMIP